MPDARQLSTVRPTIVGAQMVARAMADSQFFNQLPEFIPLLTKLRAAKIPVRTGGCGACHQHRLAVNTYQEFISTLSVLNEDGQRRVKAYFGIPSLMYNARDPVTGRIALRII